MSDGQVFRLVEELFRPVQSLLDGVFYAGVFYGACRLTALVRDVARGLRTYFLPLGNYSKCSLPKTFGKWAVITCGTSGVGVAFAHEVYISSECLLCDIKLSQSCIFHMHTVCKKEHECCPY